MIGLVQLVELHIPEGNSTLTAVVIGAVLATVGGLVATQLETILRRRERQRSAALMFGEILAVSDLIIKMADDTRGRGDPYGSITVRLLRAARREADIYDRNREQLYDLHDASLRARIHTVMIRISLTLDGIFDSIGEIRDLEPALKAMAADDPLRPDEEARLEALKEQRKGGFNFVVEIAEEIGPINKALGPIAGYNFSTHQTVVRAAQAAAFASNATDSIEAGVQATAEILTA